MHSEHIVATKVLMPVGGGMSRKVHSEYIVATKVLMPVGGRGCPGKCTMTTFLLLARGMQSMFELPSCFHIICSHCSPNFLD